MQRSRHLAALSLCAILVAGSARAEDQVIDAKSCDFFCKVWRNVSGNAQVSSDTPIDNAERASTPLPQATEGVEQPRPSTVVSQRGVVMVQTPAERAAVRRRKLALERETTKGITTGEGVMHRVLGDGTDDAAK